MRKKEETASAQLVLRVPPDMVQRAEALRVRLLKKSDVVIMGRVTRSAVLKLALVEGLATLEHRYK